MRIFGSLLGALLTIGSVAWAADLFQLIGVAFHTEQLVGGFLAVSLALVFLITPARRGAPRVGLPWYDAVMAATGFAATAYLTVAYDDLSKRVAYLPFDALVLALIILPLVIEGLRRTAGPVLVIVVLGFVAFALVGHLLPGDLEGRPVFVDQLATYLAVDTNALLGKPLYIAGTIVICFVLMGELLTRSGGSQFFTDIATATMSRYRGGPAKIAVVASSLFGSISGTAVSNVVSTGVVTIPLMRSAGYAPHQAAAIEAVASTGGQLMPPIMGAAAFVMAEFLQIGYDEVVLAALIPAILYYAALFIQIDLQAAKAGIAAVAGGRARSSIAVLRAGWIFALPFGVLIWALFELNLRPETAALYGSVVIVLLGLIVGYRGKRMRVGDVARALSATGLAVADLMMIGAAAGLIIGVLNLSGLGFSLTLALVNAGSGNLIVLLAMAAVVCIVLGMGMPTLGVYILLATLVAPALVEVGVEPLAAHLFILYFGMMSMITPPIAVAAFAAATVARCDAMRVGYEAMRLGWAAYIVPFLFVVAPSLMLRGDALSVIWSSATALGGVWLISIGVIGHFAAPLGIIRRSAFAVAGIALMVPADAYAGALWTDLVGGALGVLLVAGSWIPLRRRTRVSGPDA